MCYICVEVTESQTEILFFRQYAHFVLSTIQFMKCVALFVAPAIVAIFVKDEHDFDQWKWVFILNGGLLFVARFKIFQENIKGFR